MKKVVLAFFVSVFGLLMLSGCGNAVNSDNSEKSSESAFNFAFLTDVHLNRNNFETSSKGLAQALAHAKGKNVDFVIFGGDLVDLDGLHPQDSLAADSLIKGFKSIVEGSGVKAYFTVGNHDRYYTFNNQPDIAGYGLFEKYLGKTYYSFDHKGVHFVVLNSTQRNDSAQNYSVNPAQVEWLKSDLLKITSQTPVVVSVHVPFQSLYYPAVEGVVKNVDMFYNFKEVWDILLKYNVKIILQGHQHLHEELRVNNTHFVTGGAVSAAWWGGPLLDTEEGYMLVDIDNGGDFSWEYIDYGWEAKKK